MAEAARFPARQKPSGASRLRREPLAARGHPGVRDLKRRSHGFLRCLSRVLASVVHQCPGCTAWTTGPTTAHVSDSQRPQKNCASGLLIRSSGFESLGAHQPKSQVSGLLAADTRGGCQPSGASLSSVHRAGHTARYTAARCLSLAMHPCEPPAIGTRGASQLESQSRSSAFGQIPRGDNLQRWRRHVRRQPRVTRCAGPTRVVLRRWAVVSVAPTALALTRASVASQRAVLAATGLASTTRSGATTLRRWTRVAVDLYRLSGTCARDRQLRRPGPRSEETGPRYRYAGLGRGYVIRSRRSPRRVRATRT
jgi:hypothetical protein